MGHFYISFIFLFVCKRKADSRVTKSSFEFVIEFIDEHASALRVKQHDSLRESDMIREKKTEKKFRYLVPGYRNRNISVDI